MNKNDLKLIVFVIIMCLSFVSYFYLTKNNENKLAVIYYDNNPILKIDLGLKEEKEYQVDGYNGKVILQSKNGKIKVSSETSNYHLCSKQGYISESYQTIICLPNKIIVKIENGSKIDAEVWYGYKENS